MEKLRDQRKERGITLVALIVTIVVLLILAGVTVTMLLGDNGIITKAQRAKELTEQDQVDTEQGLINLSDQMNDALGIKTPIDQSTSYVGYYADFEGDKTVDGVIYADLKTGGSGQWGWGNNLAYGSYTITPVDNVNDYYISQKNYEGPFGTKDVISPIDDTENDRFYVMALTDFNAGTSYCWYDAAFDGAGMTDYKTRTSVNFGTGKTNTKAMISKWNAKSYGKQNTGTYLDMWGVIQDEVNKGWFVPSRAEWAAFGGAFNITQGNLRNFGLSTGYWSSSQCTQYTAWYNFVSNGMQSKNVLDKTYIRLSRTF